MPVTDCSNKQQLSRFLKATEISYFFTTKTEYMVCTTTIRILLFAPSRGISIFSDANLQSISIPRMSSHIPTLLALHSLLIFAFIYLPFQGIDELYISIVFSRYRYFGPILSSPTHLMGFSSLVTTFIYLIYPGN